MEWVHVRLGDGWCVQIVGDQETEVDAWTVLTFEDPAMADAVRERIEGAV